jgi:hypothetical protein
VGTQGAGPKYFYGDAPEVGRARRRGEVVDLVELSGNVYVGTDVVLYVLKVRLAGERGRHVLENTRTEVVYADDLVSFGEEPLAEVAADETSSASDQCPRSSGPWPSPGHSRVRTPYTGAQPSVQRPHQERYGRPR